MLLLIITTLVGLTVGVVLLLKDKRSILGYVILFLTLLVVVVLGPRTYNPFVKDTRPEDVSDESNVFVEHNKDVGLVEIDEQTNSTSESDEVLDAQTIEQEDHDDVLAWIDHLMDHNVAFTSSLSDFTEGLTEELLTDRILAQFETVVQEGLLIEAPTKETQAIQEQYNKGLTKELEIISHYQAQKEDERDVMAMKELNGLHREGVELITDAMTDVLAIYGSLIE